jgi:hypothetical protein
MSVLSSNHNGKRLPRYSTVGRVERFRWPSQKLLAPTHCGNCAARLLLGRIPTAVEPLVDVACMLCTRVACELASDAMRARPTRTPDDLAPPKRGRPLRSQGQEL